MKPLPLWLITLTASIVISDAEPIPVRSISLNLEGAAARAIEPNQLRNLELTFQRNSQGVLVSRDGRVDSDEVVVSRLKNVSEVSFSLDGLQSLQDQIATDVTKSGFAGVIVMAAPDEIDPKTGKDLRSGGRDLTLDIWLAEVVGVRTAGQGYRIKEGDAINHPKHRRILENSPIQPATHSSTTITGSGVPGVIDKPALENYLQRLNRHPVRRVEGRLSPTREPGSVGLDYLVSEVKPWVAYAQLSNTGSESTDEWRQRIGGTHYQLTGNDDILSVDFITAELDEANALIASYEIPLIHPDYLKARVFGSYSDFEAQNLVVNTQDFTGDTAIYGAEIAYTPFYWKQHALSLTAGLQKEAIEVENILAATKGSADLTTGFVRLSAEKNKQHHRSFLSIGYEENFESNNALNLTSLGRLATSDDYQLLTFDFQQSFFLEPLFGSYHRPDKDKWWTNSLVHELAFSAQGQYVLGDERLIPQKQLFAGGLYSVRGYEESVVAGDNGIIASAEYRLHLARLLKPASLLHESRGESPDTLFGQRFNYRAPDLYGTPDWNLILRGFVDYASLEITDRAAGEVENDLLSAGIGLELQLKRNISIRADYGHVLETAENAMGPIDEAEDGDSRFHLLVTFSY